MLCKRAFTLIEVLVVMAILAIFAAIAFPNMIDSQRNSAVASAQNNLFTIYGAQQNFYFNNTTGGTGIFCISQHPRNLRFFCDNLTDINSDLNLSIPTIAGNLDPSGFAYVCNNDASGFICTATKSFNGTVVTLTVKNIPIAYNGGVGIGTANPTCVSAPASIYCPVQL